MGYNEDYDFNTDNRIRNSSTENIFQVRNIYGSINMNSVNDADEGRVVYYSRFHWGFTAAAYLALFFLASAYAVVIGSFDLSFWDWPKIILSTAVVVPVFVATEYRLQGDDFALLRMLGALLIVLVGINQSSAMAGNAIVDLFAQWLVWRF
ncbi:hypothetical protein [Actinokineospora sp. NPDC004072]